MAVNLENLLPQAPESSPFSVPSNGSEQVSDLGDLFSPSMYGNGELSSLLGDATLDPSLSLKCDFPSPIGVQYVDGRETLYQTNSADIFNDNWMTTPMSLPLTPDEPTGTTSPLPPPISYTVFTSHTPTAVPLTPESLVSPQSSSDGEELDEVLSYFTDSSNDVAGQDFSSDGANYSSSHIYHESLQSPYTPTSPASYTPATPTSYLPATPTNYTPVSSPLSNSSPFPAQSITPLDTIRDLLARDQNSATPRGTNYPLKRKSGDVDVVVKPSSKRPAIAKGAGGSRKKVNASVKKERKREQNKTAALRYRQKKKEEKTEFDQQQMQLEEKNAELRSTLQGLEAEVNYLKRLWSEVEQAKRSRCQ